MKYSIWQLPKLIIDQEYLFLDEIPTRYRIDFQKFMVGQTISKFPDGRIRIGAPLYKGWLRKLYYTGFDTMVPFEYEEND